MTRSLFLGLLCKASLNIVGIVLIMSSTSNAANYSAVVSARPEYTRGAHKSVAERIMLLGKGSVKGDHLTLFADGFIESDRGNLAEERRSQNTQALQELYLQGRWEPFFIKIGRQSLRWSESWTLPSLDLWTARRWNRLFIDPLSEQLAHPTGVSSSLLLSDFSFDVAMITDPARNQWQQPLPENTEDQKTEQGARIKWRSPVGLDIALVGFRTQKKDLLGTSLSYALDDLVLKSEFGRQNEDNYFVSVGADIFIGDFSILPQFTHYRALAESMLGNDQRLFYLPIKWSSQKHSIELQAYRQADLRDNFGAISYTYTFSDYLSGTAYWQGYEGSSVLFRSYEQMTSGSVVGIRLQVDQSVEGSTHNQTAEDNREKRQETL